MPKDTFCVLGPAKMAELATTRPYFDWFSSIWLRLPLVKAFDIKAKEEIFNCNSEYSLIFS